MSSSSTWPADWILSGFTPPKQSGPGTDGKEMVLNVPQSSSVTEALPSDCLMSYPGYSLEESYLAAETQSVFSADLSRLGQILFIHIYKIYIICKRIGLITVLFQTIQFSMSTKFKNSKYCYVSLTIQLNIIHLFAHSQTIKKFYFNQFSVMLVICLHTV